MSRKEDHVRGELRHVQNHVVHDDEHVVPSVVLRNFLERVRLVAVLLALGLALLRDPLSRRRAGDELVALVRVDALLCLCRGRRRGLDKLLSLTSSPLDPRPQSRFAPRTCRLSTNQVVESGRAW